MSTTTDTMKLPSPTPQRIETLTSALSSIQSRITNTTKSHSITKPIRLVAVSKLKPASDILALHSTTPASSTSSPSSPTLPPHYHFGENYVQELIEKSRLLPRSIRWHFIGGLQSNKCVQLAREVGSLWAVESVDSVKKARLLDKGRGEMRTAEDEQSKGSDGVRNGDAEAAAGDGGKDEEKRLRVFVQVNTSGEESKSGVEPKSDELMEVCRVVRDECENLRLQGLMTIGAIARSRATTAETENEDFITLRENRDWVAEKLGLGNEELELSMGMSEDFEGAIVMGSDEVRVGSTIFGERPPKKDTKVVEDVEDNKG